MDQNASDEITAKNLPKPEERNYIKAQKSEDLTQLKSTFIKEEEQTSLERIKFYLCQHGGNLKSLMRRLVKSDRERKIVHIITYMWNVKHLFLKTTKQKPRADTQMVKEMGVPKHTNYKNSDYKGSKQEKRKGTGVTAARKKN